MRPRQHAEQAATNLPQRIKTARKAAKVTQDQLVTMAEFSPVTLSKFERGVSNPSFVNLMAICYALDVSPNYLTGWGGGGEPSESRERQQLLDRLMLQASSLPDAWIEQLISVAEKAKSGS